MTLALLLANAAPEGEGTVVLLARLLLVLPLLFGCAFFAGTETSLLSLTLAHRESLSTQAQGGDTTSGRVLWLLSNPRRLITPLILGNELINVSLSSLMTGLVQSLVQAVAKILPGEYYATGENEYITTTLGSCVSACLWDEARKVGGMNHFMLPESNANGFDLNAESGRYGVYAVGIGPYAGFTGSQPSPLLVRARLSGQSGAAIEYAGRGAIRF